MTLPANKYLMLTLALIVCACAYAAIAMDQRVQKNVNVQVSNTKESDTVSRSKIEDLEDKFNNLATELHNIRVLNEKLISRLEHSATLSDESNDTNELATSSDGLSEVVELSGIVDDLAFDPQAKGLVDSYFQDALIQRDRETEILFGSIAENPEWAGEASSFVSQQLTATSSIAADVNHVDCRDAICKVEFSIEWDDVSDPALQESVMMLSLAEKFPKSRLSQTIENGRVTYKGFLLDRSIKLPEAQTYLSDGKITPTELSEIKTLLNR